MSDFKINLSKLRIEADSLEEVEQVLQAAQQELIFISNNLNISNSHSAALCRKVSECAGNAGVCRKNIQNLHYGLETIVGVYETTENKLTEITGSISVLEKPGPEGGNQDYFPEIITGAIFGASYETKVKAGVKYKQEKDGKLEFDSLGAEVSATGEVYAAKGSLQGNAGLASGSITGLAGVISVTNAIGVNLYKNGVLSPQLYAKADWKAQAVKGDIKAAYGSENNNVHIKGGGALLGVEAEAEIAAGKITYMDISGKQKTEYGIQASLGAEGYLASGEISGGVTIFGVDIDVGVSGKAGGGGAKAGGQMTMGGISGSVSAGFGLGLELDITIDWSDFKFAW